MAEKAELRETDLFGTPIAPQKGPSKASPVEFKPLPAPSLGVGIGQALKGQEIASVSCVIKEKLISGNYLTTVWN
jgi:hypothetical protein